MDIDVFFNSHHVSSNTYVKVSCRIVGWGVFAVVYNPLTRKTQCQRYVGIGNYNEQKVLLGNRPNYIAFPIDEVAESKNIFTTFNKKELDAFKACIDDMYFACKKYMQLDTSIVVGGLEMELIHRVRTLQKDFNEFVMGGEKSELDFQVLTDEIEKNVCDEPIVKGRKFIKMVKMVNADGLTDFINGNFYEVKNILNFDGKQYYEITDRNGVNHHIHNSRIKQIAIYVEPPTETALP